MERIDNIIHRSKKQSKIFQGSSTKQLFVSMFTSGMIFTQHKSLVGPVWSGLLCTHKKLYAIVYTITPAFAACVCCLSGGYCVLQNFLCHRSSSRRICLYGYDTRSYFSDFLKLCRLFCRKQSCDN